MCLPVERPSSTLSSLTGGLQVPCRLYHPCRFYSLDHSHTCKCVYFLSFKTNVLEKICPWPTSLFGFDLNGLLYICCRVRDKIKTERGFQDPLPPTFSPGSLELTQMFHFTVLLTYFSQSHEWLSNHLLDFNFNFKFPDESRHSLLLEDFVWHVRFHVQSLFLLYHLFYYLILISQTLTLVYSDPSD